MAVTRRWPARLPRKPGSWRLRVHAHSCTAANHGNLTERSLATGHPDTLPAPDFHQPTRATPVVRIETPGPRQPRARTERVPSIERHQDDEESGPDHELQKTAVHEKPPILIPEPALHHVLTPLEAKSTPLVPPACAPVAASACALICPNSGFTQRSICAPQVGNGSQCPLATATDRSFPLVLARMWHEANCGRIQIRSLACSGPLPGGKMGAGVAISPQEAERRAAKIWRQAGLRRSGHLLRNCAGSLLHG